MPTIETTLDIQANPENVQRLITLLDEVEARIRRIQAMPVAPAGAALGQPVTGGIPTGVQTAAFAGRGVGGGSGGGGESESPEEPLRRRRRIEDAGRTFWDDFLRGMGAASGATWGMTAGLIARRLVSQITEPLSRELWGGMAAEAGGLLGGTPFTAARGVLMREQVQRLAGLEMWRGVGGAAGTGLFAGAGIAATTGFVPAAIGLAAAGLIANTVTSMLTARASAMTETEIRVRESALTTLEQRFLTRQQQLPAHVALARGGLAWQPGYEADIIRQGTQFMMSYGDLLQRMARAVSGGGLPVAPGLLAALDVRYGITPEQIASFTRAFRPGYGVSLPAGATPADLSRLATEALEQAIHAGVRAGIADTDMPRYLQQVAAFNQQMAERGITIDPTAFSRILTAAAETGLRGRAAETVAPAFRDIGLRARERILGTIADEGLVADLALLGAMRRRLPGETIVDVLRNLGQPDQAYEALRIALRGIAPDIQALLLSRDLGLERALQLTRGGGLPELPPPTAAEESRITIEAIVDWLRSMLDAGQLAAGQLLALAQSLQEVAVDWGKMPQIAGDFIETIRAVNEVMRELASEEMVRGIARLRLELDRLITAGRRGQRE